MTTGFKDSLIVLASQFDYPSPALLMRQDPRAISVVWRNRYLLLRFTNGEIVYDENATAESVQKVLPEIKRLCLESTVVLEHGDGESIIKFMHATCNALNALGASFDERLGNLFLAEAYQ